MKGERPPKPGFLRPVRSPSPSPFPLEIYPSIEVVMKPLRVAHVSNYCHGGALAMTRLHHGLLEHGVQSTVVSEQDPQGIPSSIHLKTNRFSRRMRWMHRLGFPCGSSQIGLDWHQEIRKARRSNKTYELFSPPICTRPIKNAEALRSQVERCDILHLHWFGGIVDYREFFRDLTVPVVWTLHDQHPYLGGFHYQGDVQAATGMRRLEEQCRRMKRDALSQTPLAVAANSDWNLHESMASDVLPPHTIRKRLYLPLPLEHFTPIAKSKAKRALGLDPTKFVIGFASASLDNRRKGLNDLANGLADLPISVQEKSTLLSFGSGEHHPVLRDANIGWKHLGSLQDQMAKSTAYSAMDVFVIASLEEAFGQTPLEALACKTAVIGTNVGGIPETVQEGETGTLVEPKMPPQIRDAILFMKDQPRLRKQWGEAGRELAASRHDQKQVTKDHLALYEQMIESKNVSGLAPAA